MFKTIGKSIMRPFLSIPSALLADGDAVVFTFTATASCCVVTINFNVIRTMFHLRRLYR